MLYTATTLRQIFNLTGSGPKNKARNSRIKGIRPSIEKDLKRFSFLVKSKESYSWPSGHITSITYPGLTLKKFRNDRRVTPMSTSVWLHCTCPAFLYWGSKYWSTQYSYNFPDKSETRPPNVRDPLGANWTCKHGIRAMNYVSKKGFEKLYSRFTKKSSLIMASKEEIWKAAAEFLSRTSEADESHLAQIYPQEYSSFITSLEDNGVFGPVGEKEICDHPSIENLVNEDLFG